MNNIKKVVFYSILILTAQPLCIYCGHAKISKEEKDFLKSKARYEQAEAILKQRKTEELQQNQKTSPKEKRGGVGSDLGKNAGERFSENLKESSKILKETSDNLKKTSENCKDSVTTLTKVGVVIFVCHEVKNGINYFSPDKKLERIKASQEIEIIALEEKLRGSLTLHAQEEKNYRGIPAACEVAANKYATVAGFAALEKILEEFRQATR